MKVRNAIRGAAMVGATAMTLAVPAQALAAQPQGGVVAPLDWNGNCSTTTYSGSAWGWCDGTGPQRYRIFVNCANGGIYGSNSTPWFGDRRGASVYCPSGVRAIGSWGGRA